MPSDFLGEYCNQEGEIVLGFVVCRRVCFSVYER